MTERPPVRVTLALLARYAEVDPDSGLLNIVGGSLDVFGVRQLPVQFTLAFALQFRYPQDQAGVTRVVTLTLRDPSLHVVGEPSIFDVTPRLTEYHAEGWQGTFSVCGGIELTVEVPGTHSIGIELDGVQSGDIPYQVFVVDENYNE